jgi:hypothetical protein
MLCLFVKHPGVSNVGSKPWQRLPLKLCLHYVLLFTGRGTRKMLDPPSEGAAGEVTFCHDSVQGILVLEDAC